MVHGAVLSIFDGIGSISLDVLATTLCAANLRQCHARPPLTKKMCLWGRIMTLYSRNVQTYCSLEHDIKRNQCPPLGCLGFCPPLRKTAVPTSAETPWP